MSKRAHDEHDIYSDADFSAVANLERQSHTCVTAVRCDHCEDLGRFRGAKCEYVTPFCLRLHPSIFHILSR